MSKKILVISDNHGNKEIVLKILANEPHDLAIHLGDSELGEKWIKQLFDYYVSGNNDFDFTKNEVFFHYQNYKFGILHGHTQGISIFNAQKPALRFAKNNNLDIILHGHTHIPYFSFQKGVFICCPGSPERPRSKDGATYGIIRLENNKIFAEIKTINMLK